MVIDPGLVLFAIQAGVKLGRKTYDVLVDSTQAAPLALPLGALAGSIQEAEAIEFFDQPENRPLVAAGGPYFNFKGGQLVVAYHTVRVIDDRLGGGPGSTADAVALLQELHRFEQQKEGFGPKSPWQRIAGTVVEIGIDFFVANPQAMGKDSSARRVVEAFLVGIQDIPFAEGDPLQIVGDTLVAGLKVLGDNATLISNDGRIHVLLGGVTGALLTDLQGVSLQSLGERQRREDFIKRVTTSVLRGGAEAVARNADLFVVHDEKATAIVRSTLTSVLEGVRGKENLFSNDGLEALFVAALKAASSNVDLVTDKPLVRDLVKQTVAALTDVKGGQLFSGAAVQAIAHAALDTLAENMETLIDARDPQRQFLAETLAAMAHGLASDVAGEAPVKKLLSTDQLLELTQTVFREVARHPERLLGVKPQDPRGTALAQILGSVAGTLGDDPTRLVNGAMFLELVRTSLAVALKNRDNLLDLTSPDPKTNLLHNVLDGVARAALGDGDHRGLLDRDVFVDVASRVLRVASANVGALRAGDAKAIESTLRSALRLASGTLQDQINGENLPAVVEGLLRGVLLNGLQVEDSQAAAAAAGAILRAA